MSAAMPSPQRRQSAARRRHQLPEEIRHRGFARPVLPRSDRLVGGRAERLSALPLQRPRDHPRLRRQQRRRPSNSCWRTASKVIDRHAEQIGGTRSAFRCCAPCRSRSRTGRWSRPAGRPIRTMTKITRRRRLDPAARGRGAQGRRRDSARAPHDRDPSRDAARRPRHSASPSTTTARRSTSAPARP